VSFTKDELASGEIYYNFEDSEQAASHESDELPGLSVFYKDERGTVYHTYSSYARGDEEAISTFVYVDLTPKGRNEGEIMDWVKRNDEYDKSPQSCCHSPADKSNNAQRA
jgi:predicted dithiol-disulfide oxidoreductase (DUF899 family)